MKQGWKIKRLGEVCNNAGNIRWQDVEPSADLPYIDLSAVDRDSSSIREYQYVNSHNAPSRAKQIVKEGDVIFATTRPTLKRLCVITPDFNDAICSTGFCVLRPTESILTKWLFYNLKSDEYYAYIEPLQKGASYPAITDGEVRNYELPIPSLAEQERIVEILDREFEGIDALKANAEQNLQHAKDLFQAALKQELQPKEGWETKTISEISENLDYKRVPVTKKDRKEGVYPYYGASGIVDYVDDFLLDEDLLLVSEDGANLLARTTPIAFSVSGKIWVNNHAHILRFANIELQKFVEYFFANYDISRYVTGAAQPKFNQKALNNIVVPYPTDIVEQRKVVSRIDELNERCKALEENYKKTIVLCDDMKQALLRKAFNGEL